MKRFISLILALTVFLSISIVAHADKIDAPDGSEIEIVAVKPGDPMRAEETMWYFRVVDGIMQMRLWSITYRKWLTDWIIVGPVDP